MTIFVNNNVSKKEESDSSPPEVVGEVKVCLCVCVVRYCSTSELAPSWKKCVFG